MEYNKKIMSGMAENLERFMDTMDSYVIIRGITKDEYDWAQKKVKKAVKHLKKGKGKKVFDPERYRELLESGKLDDL